MSRTVVVLLKGFLARNAWVYAVLGLTQFLLTGDFWFRNYGRMPVAGAALGAWGAAAALNANSLAWRSLPLNSRDASVYRWWASAGTPAIYLTLIVGIDWVSNRSSGFPTPAPDIILEGVCAIWAVMGIVALLSPAPRFYRQPLWGKAFVSVTCAAILLCVGVPIGSGARPYSLVFIAVGWILLVTTALRAYSGRYWRWPDIASRSTSVSTAAAKKPGAAALPYRYGIWTVLLPLLQRTAIVAAIATALVAAMHFVFPRAGAALFWVYFIGISTVGFLLTFQFRSALQPLRCLPLSTQQLAGLLLALGALPGVMTLGLSFLVNRALLGADLDFSAIATFALIMIAMQALPLGPRIAQGQAPHLGRHSWVSLALRIFWTVYLGVMAGNLSGAFVKWWWLRCVLITAGFGLCAFAYFVLAYQLRAGIRPSGNEKIFSAG